MESIQQVAERIVNLSPGSPSKEVCIEAVKFNITCLVGDILKIIKNINETSLPGSDRFIRILELEKKYGIPVNYIL